jgi:predicted nucleic acid-binding protein
LDSNILVKLVLNEQGSKEAQAHIVNALQKGYTLHTVDIALAESLNVIWKHVNLLKDLLPQEVPQTIEDLTKIYDKLNIVKTREITIETAQIAQTQNLTVYDALFIAAAQKLNGTLYTADQKLYITANKIRTARLLKPKP